MRLLVTIVFVLAFCTSCKDDRPVGPEEIYYGEDVCERCKMIISVEEFSSQYVLQQGETRKFDDLGCMLHYISNGELGEAEIGEIKTYYVRDYSSGEWIDGRSAYYLWSEGIKTPMGYGIVAFDDKNDVKELPEAESTQMIGGFDAAALYMKDK